MNLYKDYSSAIANMGEGVFDFSVALFRSKYYEPHSELFHDFMSSLEPAMNRENDYTGEHKIQFFDRYENFGVTSTPYLVAFARLD